MSAIVLRGFIGEQPRILPTLIAGNAAQQAINVRLDDGGLTPQRRPVPEATIASAAHQTIYRWSGSWLSWDGIVHAAPGPVATERLYRTDGVKPKLRVATTDYDLALPAPASALTATLGGVGAGDTTTRIYVYTWVTGFGEESKPCAVSNSIDWKPGNTVTLSGFLAAPAGRNITKQRIYRSQTGQSGTYFYLIAERAASNANFADTVAVDAFADALPSLDYDTPPDALEGLTSLPNGIMAGFVGKDLYFSEPYRPHAWPLKYVLTTDYSIVGLGAVGNTLVIATTGKPYVAVGTHPQSMQMDAVNANLPCLNRRSIANLGFALVYASHEGIVAVDGSGTARLVSANLFNRDGWAVFDPSTIIGGQISGRYVAFYDTLYEGTPLQGALLVDVGDAPFLMRTDAVANAVFYEIGSGALFFLDKGTSQVMLLDAPGGAREQMYWRSKQFEFSMPVGMAVLRVRTKDTLTGDELDALNAAIAAVVAANAAAMAAGSIDGDLAMSALGDLMLGGDTLEEPPDLAGAIEVGVIADGVKVAQVSVTNRAQRLPGGFRAHRWEIDVSGDQQVTEIVVAGSMHELKAVPTA